MDPFGRFSRPPLPRKRYPDTVDGLAQLLHDTAPGRVVALTGAGMSTASGLPDFRGKGGMWENTDPMKECSLSAFRNDPVRFWRFYRDRLSAYAAEPNAAHRALVDLERMGKLRYVLTQNIDALHQAAGSSRVVELHGNPRTVSCPRCGQSTTWDEAVGELADETGVPRCQHGHAMKPDIVLFEETLPHGPVARAQSALADCDVLLCLGSSLVVNPVAGFVPMVRRAGGDVVIVTAGGTPHDPLAQIKLTDPLEQALPAAVAALAALRAGA